MAVVELRPASRSVSAPYRGCLPQLRGQPMVTDAGLEAALALQSGVELPAFAAFGQLRTAGGRRRLRDRYDRFALLARRHGMGLVLESPTWRANPDWGRALGYSLAELADINREAIELVADVRDDYEALVAPIVVSGCVGPRADSPRVGEIMSPEEAADYHSFQVGVFAGTAADMVCAMAITRAEEAIGVTRAARSHGLPVAISFTLETGGRLPGGESLAEAIARVDSDSAGGPDYFVLDCAHPEHVEPAVSSGEPWLSRVVGLHVAAFAGGEQVIAGLRLSRPRVPGSRAAGAPPLARVLPRWRSGP